jgi:hypothetical protein
VEGQRRPSTASLTGNAARLGYYSRIVECGGVDRAVQVMLVSTDGREMTPPAGGVVRSIDREPARKGL